MISNTERGNGVTLTSRRSSKKGPSLSLFWVQAGGGVHFGSGKRLTDAQMRRDALYDLSQYVMMECILSSTNYN